MHNPGSTSKDGQNNWRKSVDQRSENSQVTPIVPGSFPLRCLQDLGDQPEAPVIQDGGKAGLADHSPADVIVAVNSASQFFLAVIRNGTP